MTEEIRPICLYIETCLDRKEGTRDCAKCEHHLNYWTEVMIRDMEKNITRLEQENKELRQQYNCYACDTCQGKEDYRNMKRHCKNAIKTVHAYRSALEEIKTMLGYGYIVDKINEVLK